MQRCVSALVGSTRPIYQHQRGEFWRAFILPRRRDVEKKNTAAVVFSILLGGRCNNQAARERRRQIRPRKGKQINDHVYPLILML